MLGPVEVQMAMEEKIAFIDALVEEIREAGRSAAEKENLYKTRYAQARLNIRNAAFLAGTKKTADTVDDEATIETSQDHYEFIESKHNLSTLREALDANKSDLESLRTIAVGYRAVT